MEKHALMIIELFEAEEPVRLIWVCSVSGIWQTTCTLLSLSSPDPGISTIRNLLNTFSVCSSLPGVPYGWGLQLWGQFYWSIKPSRLNHAQIECLKWFRMVFEPGSGLHTKTSEDCPQSSVCILYVTKTTWKRPSDWEKDYLLTDEASPYFRSTFSLSLLYSSHNSVIFLAVSELRLLLFSGDCHLDSGLFPLYHMWKRRHVRFLVKINIYIFLQR